MISMRRMFAIVGIASLATALHARENAVLRNGFSISHDHHREIGAVTRLFLSPSDEEYVDVPTANIMSFEKEEELFSPEIKKTPDEAIRRSDLCCDVNQIIERAAQENQLDSDFVHAVIRAESGGNAAAVSPKGAQGLMQLLPQTATRLGVKNSFDPEENVGAGTKYLRALLARYHNDPVQALAAYNAGAGRVQQYHGVPPYKETQAYVAGIIRDFNRRKLEEKRAASQSRKSAQAKAAHRPPNGD